MVSRRSLKVNADKSKVIVLGVEEGLECEIRVDEVRLEKVSEKKSWIDTVNDCLKNVWISGKQGEWRGLVKGECV